MANVVWGQDNFTKGELSPMLYARTTATQYYLGLRQAFNCHCYPQGAVGKRFGSLFRSIASNITSADDVFFMTFQYDEKCTYQILVRDDNIDIYLEGLLISTVGTTGMSLVQVQNMDYTVLDRELIITTLKPFAPKHLLRAANAGETITSVSSKSFTMSAATFTADRVYPVKFTIAGGSGIVTSPQIEEGVTYFAWTESTTEMQLYATSKQALRHSLEDVITISSIGTGTTTTLAQNTWTFPAITFKNLPVYDFLTNYDAITFTPSAVVGTTTLTASSAIFTAAHVNGAFVGGGGVARITAIGGGTPPVTTATIDIMEPFTGDLSIPPTPVAISGKIALLAQPAWSTTLGYPTKCSSYQNRAIYCNSEALPNGFWASAINDYRDFNDIAGDDDDAISWYPSSDNINYIRFIVPYRSITIHTNSGVYSSPLSFETAITPTNFSLMLQDSSPADVVQPQNIDNQIMICSGNDVHNLLWDGYNNAYTSNIISIFSEHLIREPVDEFVFQDMHRAGSRYLFVVNANGTMAMYQTLISQEISGWVLGGIEQSYGDASFRQGDSSLDGRVWFLNEREIATEQTPVSISAVLDTVMTATGTNFDTATPTAVRFATTGTIPTSTPQINTTDWFWVIGIDADTFTVYKTQSAAEEETGAIVFSALGATSTIIPWTKVANFTIEELTFDTFLDCAVRYEGAATATVSNLPLYNAQEIKMVGDGFGFEAVGINDTVTFEAHGDEVEVEDAYIGFPINTIIETLPVSIPKGDQSTLTRPNHIRNVNFIFNNTIGGYVDEVPIALSSLTSVIPGDPPLPRRGIFPMSIMKGWDDFNNPAFTITHSDPFDIQLLGVFYTVDIYQ